MGAFFLHHQQARIDGSKVAELYLKKGFSAPFSFQVGDYHLKLYKKKLVDIKNFFSIGADHIFVCGSLFYRGLDFQKSLECLLSDFINHRIDANELNGNYVILFYNDQQKRLAVCLDPAFIKNVYYDLEKKIISSDFLAIVEAAAGSCSLNQLAVVENLTTGHLISPDTYANEIQKLDRKGIERIESGFPGIKAMVFYPAVIESIHKYEDAIEHANSQLSEYFQSVKKLADEFGAHIGLTGGFDSRLLLMHARKHLQNLITNSFWRPNSIEFIHAQELAKAAGLDFISFAEKPFLKPNKNEMMSQAYLFFDGQIRSQNNWDEEFSLPEYSARIAANHLVGFHGCGGEQYRNADRLMGKTSLDKWIHYEWMFRQCENPFLDRNLQSAVSENITKKIRRLVDIPGNRLGLLELKKIQNEVWNASNRATRVNVLNQQQFYFAPFAEYRISHAAYSYVPYLGKSLAFQLRMMRKTDPELAGAKTNYGFTIMQDEPLKLKMIPYLMKLLPRAVFYKIYFRIKRSQRNQLDANDFNNGAVPFLRELGKRIDLQKLLKNKNLGSALTSCAFLLPQMKLRH